MNHAYAIVMAGGAGTRFWPASRETRPKQLLPLGKDGEILLRATVRRLASVIPSDRVYIATNRRIEKAVQELLPDVPKAQILAEPAPRNTAPCIGWATAAILRRDPEAVIAVLPSDQTIDDEAAFAKSIQLALESGASGSITTIGVVPSRPETGFGYIEVGDAVSEGVKRVARFVEKPNLETAKGYLAGGKHLWNAGMFFFRAQTMIDALGKHMPKLAEGLRAIDEAETKGNGTSVVDELFPKFESVSIDYGVMEKESGLRVVPGDFGWSDLGSWESAWDLAKRDDNGNALDEGTIAVDSKGLLVRNLSKTAGKKIIALVGLNDLVVVETDDAILVLPRDRAQDVRLIVDQLKKSGAADRL